MVLNQVEYQGVKTMKEAIISALEEDLEIVIEGECEQGNTWDVIMRDTNLQEKIHISIVRHDETTEIYMMNFNQDRRVRIRTYYLLEEIKKAIVADYKINPKTRLKHLTVEHEIRVLQIDPMDDIGTYLEETKLWRQMKRCIKETPRRKWFSAFAIGLNGLMFIWHSFSAILATSVTVTIIKSCVALLNLMATIVCLSAPLITRLPRYIKEDRYVKKLNKKREALY